MYSTCYYEVVCLGCCCGEVEEGENNPVFQIFREKDRKSLSLHSVNELKLALATNNTLGYDIPLV